jgi:hypothetical protein
MKRIVLLAAVLLVVAAQQVLADSADNFKQTNRYRIFLG